MSYVASDGRSPALGLPVSGVALDLIKAMAAVFMIGDHINTILLSGAIPNLYIAGRIAFPLFCYAAACHLARRGEAGGYSAKILLFAVLAQPIFAWADEVQLGNVLFTLAAGAAVGAAIVNAGPLVRHAFFTAVTIVSFAMPVSAYTGVEFGVAGVALPAAIALLLRRDATALPWLVAMLFLINMSPPQPENPNWWWWFWATGLSASLGGAATVAVASLAPRTGRALPRYFLHVFYPAHLALLAALRHWQLLPPFLMA